MDIPERRWLQILYLSFQFLVIISFIKLILLKIRVRNVKFQIYEWQHATASGAFTARLKQWRVSLFLRNAPLAVACLLLIYTKRASEMEALRGVWTKRVTASGVFCPRH
jgi:hypothetical protein